MPKKRADGRYEIKVKVSRKGEPRKYTSVYGETLRQAKENADKVKSTLNQPKSETTVAEAVEYWLTQKEKNLRPRTITCYRSSLRFVVDALGQRKLNDITVDDVRQLHDKVAEFSVVQANYMATRMYSVYKDANIRGIAAGNPWQFVTPFRHEKAEKRALTKEEIDAVLSADLNPWERAYISVLRYTGMRRGEALALDAADVDLKGKVISISKNNADGHIGPPKTKAAVRKVPMPDPLVGILSDYLKQYHSGEGLLFPSVYGHPMRDTGFTNAWWRMARKIFNGDPPADFTPHIFRHTYASELVRNKVPPTTAMLLLGHKNIATTMDVYTHLGWQDIDAEQINDIFRKES